MTPGVYTVDINAFPNSVAQVPTAIPAFIGYTERAVKDGNHISGPLLINSLAEYRSLFGTEPEFQYPVLPVVQGTNHDVMVNGKKYTIGDAAPGKRFYLYHCLELFYQNGGGPCYIASIGSYASKPAKEDLLLGVDQLKTIPSPKPTLILIPDALLLSAIDYFTVQQEALLQCGTLRDRVALLDIYNGDQSNSDAGVIDKFRNSIGNNFLDYGIAYYPFLATNIVEGHDVTFANVDQTATGGVKLRDLFPGAKELDNLATITGDLAVAQGLSTPPPLSTETGVPTLLTAGASGVTFPYWQVLCMGFPGSLNSQQIFTWKATVIRLMAQTLYNLGTPPLGAPPGTGIQTPDLIAAVREMMAPTGTLASVIHRLAAMDTQFFTDKGKAALGVFTTTTLGAIGLGGGSSPDPSKAPSPYFSTDHHTAFNVLSNALDEAFKVFNAAVESVPDIAKSLLVRYNGSLANNNSDYFNLMSAIAAKASVLPPCPAMAGIYTLTDNTEGVWKAPANVNISSVIAPTVAINDNDQASLNVDALAGKSINAIRSFYGRGPAIVWGARTLDGNSSDFRYVNVRRTLIMIEQSVANVTFSLVFEPNDESTWRLCAEMISNFLHTLWVAGALQGASPPDAYSVSVGLGTTMTEDDILQGIMRVQVNVALVHPAEFIVITYDQPMAKS